jgi:O-methyltransferase involved in polyketide biosynthesis
MSSKRHAVPTKGFPAVAEQATSAHPFRDDQIMAQPCDGIVPGLAGVSQTMLWSLHNRATETGRPDGVLDDPESVRIQAAINFDFAGHFGDPQGSLAARAAEIDRSLRSWLERHPEGTVISLGEGLETQARRVDNGRMRWLSVDLPDAIRLRERFIEPTDRFRHIAASALDPVWMDAVDPSSGVFIVAQGLLMYLAPERVRELFAGIADRFPGSEIVFDVIPRWFSGLTVLGLHQTASYRLPAMPWGINRDEVEPVLRRWHPAVATVAILSYRSPRGIPRLVAGMTNRMPVARHGVPGLVHVTIAGGAGASAITDRIATEIDAGDESPRFTTASGAVMTIGRATIGMAGLAEAQRAWLARAAAGWIAMGFRVLEARAAAMAPVRDRVIANAERLGRSRNVLAMRDSDGAGSASG